MAARKLTSFYLKLLLLSVISWPLLAAQDRIVLVAEKNTPALSKLLNQLSKITTDFTYQVSTNGKPIAAKIDDYVISIGAKKAAHFDYTQFKNSISVMLTAEQAEQMNTATSIFIEPPLSRQLKLANLLIPGNKKLGFLVSNENDKNEIFSALNEDEKDILKVVNIENYDNINQALFHALKDTRLLLGSYNNKIYSAKNIKNILITSYRQQKVLVGPSRAYLKAGSFATTFSDLTHIARRIIDIVQHHQKSGQWLEAGYNPYYRILFNAQVARSLNLRIVKEDVLRKKMGDE